MAGGPRSLYLSRRTARIPGFPVSSKQTGITASGMQGKTGGKPVTGTSVHAQKALGTEAPATGFGGAGHRGCGARGIPDSAGLSFRLN